MQTSTNPVLKTDANRDDDKYDDNYDDKYDDKYDEDYYIIHEEFENYDNPSLDEMEYELIDKKMDDIYLVDELDTTNDTTNDTTIELTYDDYALTDMED